MSKTNPSMEPKAVKQLGWSLADFKSRQFGQSAGGVRGSIDSWGGSIHMRVQVRYSGRVQGVGFRATVLGIARGQPVSGWVRNEPDGSVLMEIQGESAAIRAVREEIRAQMSRNIRSENAIDLQDGPDGGTFEIRR